MIGFRYGFAVLSASVLLLIAVRSPLFLHASDRDSGLLPAASPQVEYLDEEVSRADRGNYGLKLYGERAVPPEGDPGFKIPKGTQTLHGVDVSGWQRNVDWKQASSGGIVFAVAKATEGRFTDRMFAGNWLGLAAVRSQLEVEERILVRGAYHFFRPLEDASQQAAVLLGALGGELGAGDLPPTLDLEWDWADARGQTDDRWDRVDRDERIRRVMVWLATVEKALGRPPMIYTNYHFWLDKFGSYEPFIRYPLWIADYSSLSAQAGEPVHLPHGAPRWLLWQFTSRGRVPGIQGNVDINRFVGSVVQLKVLAGLLAPSAAPNLMSAVPAVLRRGVTGSEVATLQNQLIVLGLLRESVLAKGLGTFGPRTEAALKAFQQDNGLPVTGIHDTQTRGLLQAIGSGIRVGADSHLVLRVKQRLVELEFLSSREIIKGSGAFGPKTQAGLKRFQKAKQLTADGVLNPTTYRALFPRTAREVLPESEEQEEG